MRRRWFQGMVWGGLFAFSNAGMRGQKSVPAWEGTRDPGSSHMSDTAVPLPTARQLIDRHNEAVGGRAAFAAYQSVHMLMTVDDTYSSITQRDWYGRKPSQFLERVMTKLHVSWSTGFTGTYAWSSQGNREMGEMGGDLLTGASVTRVRLQAEALWSFIDQSRFIATDSVQRTTLDDRSVYQVRVVRPDSAVDTLYFDPDSGYKVAETTRALFGTIDRERRAGTRGDKRMGGTLLWRRYLVVYSGYTLYGRLRFPRVIQERIAPDHFETMTVQRLELNMVDPLTFALPYELETQIRQRRGGG